MVVRWAGQTAHCSVALMVVRMAAWRVPAKAAPMGVATVDSMAECSVAVSASSPAAWLAAW
jgi:hypothetical protein